jgi:hypothetical protein
MTGPLYMQALIFDPGAAQNVATTRAVEITFGDL